MSTKHHAEVNITLKMTVTADAKTAHHLWLAWAQIALDHEGGAWEARERSLAQEPAVRDTSLEMRESLQAVTAAAFAIDGWYGDTHRFLWREDRTKSGNTKRVMQSVRHATKDRAVHGRAFRKEVDWLFRFGGVRGHAVHHSPKLSSGLQHPAMPPSASSAERVIYSAGAASRAIDVLTAILRACLCSPSASLNPWIAGGMRTLVSRLVDTADERPPRQTLSIDWPRE